MADEISKNYGIMKYINLKVNSDDAILNGIFSEGMNFEKQLKEYNRVINESIEIIKERKKWQIV